MSFGIAQVAVQTWIGVVPCSRLTLTYAKDRCILSLDASGDRLHRRGYRRQSADAPLRETLAAAIVELVAWDNEGMFIDPMCGSGTIVIEATLKAMNYAPGLLRCGDGSSGRAGFGFQRWRNFDRKLWERLTDEARAEIREKIPGRILADTIFRDQRSGLRRRMRS